VKLKLDENLDVRFVPVLKDAGFDADSVLEEKLEGSPDDSIYET
jgi:hypothetical protein